MSKETTEVRGAVAGRVEQHVRRQPLPKRLPAGIGRRIGDTDDLPEQLKAQLRQPGAPTLEMQILDIVKDLDGACTVDEVIVSLWRKHKVLTKDRRALANRLYRMTTKGQLDSVRGRKGVWALPILIG
jgi:hypothetical protein